MEKGDGEVEIPVRVHSGTTSNGGLGDSAQRSMLARELQEPLRGSAHTEDGKGARLRIGGRRCAGAKVRVRERRRMDAGVADSNERGGS